MYPLGAGDGAPQSPCPGDPAPCSFPTSCWKAADQAPKTVRPQQAGGGCCQGELDGGRRPLERMLPDLSVDLGPSELGQGNEYWRQMRAGDFWHVDDLKLSGHPQTELLCPWLPPLSHIPGQLRNRSLEPVRERSLGRLGWGSSCPRGCFRKAPRGEVPGERQPLLE